MIQKLYPQHHCNDVTMYVDADFAACLAMRCCTRCLIFKGYRPCRRPQIGSLKPMAAFVGKHAAETGKPQQPPASAVSTHPKQGNPGKIHAHRVATGSAEPLLLGTFEPAKNKGGWVKQEALAGSRHWLGGRNGPEQNRAASAIPKARHSPQRHQ